MLNKKTLVLGASPNPERYSNKAVRKLKAHGHDVVAVAKRSALIDEVPVLDTLPELHDIDTVTLYVGPDHQPEYYNYLMQLHPKRIIFNPGAENAELEKMAEENGIEALEACTLVLLSTGQY